MEGSKKQAEMKKEFFNVREILCKKDENKHCIICSPFFQEFYVYLNYHYEQFTQHVIQCIIKDIQNMNLKYNTPRFIRKALRV
jgi:hypothetical protein